MTYTLASTLCRLSIVDQAYKNALLGIKRIACAGFLTTLDRLKITSDKEDRHIYVDTSDLRQHLKRIGAF